MRIETQFSVFLINKPGVLASVTEALSQAGVNLSALALMDSGEHGALRIVCDNPEQAEKVLQETHDRWTKTDVLVMDMSDDPGAFAKLSRRLADERVNVTYAYATGGTRGEKAIAVLKVADLERAKAILGESA